MNITLDKDTGVVSKDGEKVGHYDANKNVVLLDKRPSPKLYGPLKEVLGEEVRIDIAPSNEPHSSAMQEPPRDPMKGDLTPEYVAWMKATDPERAARQYAGRFNLDMMEEIVVSQR